MKPLSRIFGVAAIASGLFSALALAAPPKSGLVFCNRGNQGTVHVAVAFPAGKQGWNTEGWLSLEQGKCETAIAGKLANRFYYYYAETDRDYAWKGEQQFCISNSKFSFVNADTQCRGSSSHWAKFRELDTGLDAEGYTLNLE